MANIKVKELKEALKSIETSSTLEVEFKGLALEIKTYLPIIDKITLVSSIYYSAVDITDENQAINYNSLNIAYKNLVVREYTNITLPKDTIETYNLITSSGLYDFIYNKIPLAERLELETVFDNYIDEKQERYERENTLPNIVKNMLNGLVDKLPSMDEAKTFIEQASKELNNLNPDNLKFVQDFMKINKGENIADI